MVNTVLGPISADKLGKTLIHEHIYCGSTYLHKAFDDRWFDRDELAHIAAQKLIEAKEKFGLCTVVDGTPCSIGRDVKLLIKVSQLSGVNIVASSGMYYTADTYLNGTDSDRLSQYFVDECKNGMEDTYKHETPVLPGILKCATGSDGLTPINEMLLETMAKTQVKTRLPMFAHNEHHIQTAPKQIEIFKENGVDLSKIVIGHASDCSDVEYLESLLEEGVYLGFDRIHCKESQVKTIDALVKNGWGSKILLSRDGGVFMQFNGKVWETDDSRECNRFTEVVGRFAKMLKDYGIAQSDIDAMFEDNVKRLFE